MAAPGWVTLGFGVLILIVGRAPDGMIGGELTVNATGAALVVVGTICATVGAIKERGR